MTNVELVIFDCDGVLVDSEPIVNRVFAETLTEAGFVTHIPHFNFHDKYLDLFVTHLRTKYVGKRQT